LVPGRKETATAAEDETAKRFEQYRREVVVIKGAANEQLRERVENPGLSRIAWA
jgi:hypothetical protein